MTARPRLVPALLGLALTGSVLSGVTASAAPQAPTPQAGATGIGDPYFPQDGNGGIDVLHYDVHDSYAFGSGRLTGRTRLDLRVTADLSRFDLDFLLPVRSVRVDGRRAQFELTGDHELRIVPAEAIATGQHVRVTVRYAGFPATKRSGGESNWLADDEEVVAMNEPHMAAWWFPANDHPLDKASYDIHITVPKGKDVIANGVLVDRRAHGGRATTHWRAVEPMASYLAFFAAGSFETRSGTYEGRPYYVAVSRAVPEPLHHEAMALMLRSGEVTAWLESLLGTYPFSTTGGLVTSLPVSFALENQTRPTYPAVGSGSVSLVVHELAHQWFGDSVSVHGWRDVWLNEGFAEFMQTYYAEAHGGTSAQTWLDDTYDRYQPIARFWKLRIDDPGHRHLFDGQIYDRGAMAVQALRHLIGDTAFWQVLRTWVDQRRYGNGSIPEFEALAASVSGRDLTSFFDAWLHQQAPPAKTAENGLG